MYNESGDEGGGRLKIIAEYVHSETADERELLLQGKHFKKTVRGKRNGAKKGDLKPVDSMNAVTGELAKCNASELMSRFDNKPPVRTPSPIGS